MAIEFETVEGKRGRYVVTNQEGLEVIVLAARRSLVIRFDPDKVDFDITPTEGYRFFAKGEAVLEKAPPLDD